MNKNARYTIVGILVLLVVDVSVRAESASSQTAVHFGETVGRYIHEHSANGIDIKAVKKYIDSLTRADKPATLAFDWPGEESAVLAADLNQDGVVEFLVSRFESETVGSLYVYSSPDYRKSIQYYPFRYPESFAVRGSQILVADLTGDGQKDIIVRQFTGAQRVQSIDCIFVVSGAALDLKYTRCFSQFSALEDMHPNESYVRKASSQPVFDGSYFVDLDGNGSLEIVVTADYCPQDKLECDRASYVIWPDIYRWNGNAYEQANRLFPGYYRKYQAEIERQLKQKYYPAALPFALKRVNEILDAK